MAAALPFITALSPILAPVLGNILAPTPDAPQLAPPPQAPEIPSPEATVQPEGVLDREAARARTVARRRAQSRTGGLLALQEEEEGVSSGSVKRKTLLGS